MNESLSFDILKEWPNIIDGKFKQTFFFNF